MLIIFPFLFLIIFGIKAFDTLIEPNKLVSIIFVKSE